MLYLLYSEFQEHQKLDKNHWQLQQILWISSTDGIREILENSLILQNKVFITSVTHKHVGKEEIHLSLKARNIKAINVYNPKYLDL